MPYRFFIHLAYKGSLYAGWQIQPNAVTVQEIIEKALSMLAAHKAGVVGCGRTDTGVHATDFYCHFDSEIVLSAADCEQLVYKLNRYLPNDIVILNIQPVAPEAHARFSALWREYEYRIILQKDPFLYQDSYLVHGSFQVELMNECAQLLIGTRDFECFSKVNTQVNNFVCKVYAAEFLTDKHILTFTIRADRFLRNMVRAIVGTLLDVGRGKLSKDEFRAVLDSHNRCMAGYSVPACGLRLTKVCYPDELFISNPLELL